MKEVVHLLEVVAGVGLVALITYAIIRLAAFRYTNNIVEQGINSGDN